MAAREDTRCRDLLPRAIAKVANAQAGRISRAQLVALGVGPRTIPRWVRAGRLHPMHPGVYAVGHAAHTVNGARWAAVLATGGVISHRDAASILGVATWHGRPQVSVPRGRRAPAGVTVHTTRSLHPDDLALDAESRLPHASWARTTIDLAEEDGVHAMARHLERSEIARRYDGLALAPAMSRAHGRHGLPTLVAALNLGHHLDPQRTRSPKDEAHLRRLRAEGAGEYVVNHWMWVHDRFVEADVWFPARRLIVEIDSRWHDTAGARARDAGRDAACRAAGIEVVRLR